MPRQTYFRGGGRVTRISEAPRRIHVELVQSEARRASSVSRGCRWSIANAVLALTGKRLRELPLIGR